MWINGQYLGKRPNGYVGFQYNLTPYLKFGEAENEILVKVDNAQQPNSRWYSGSGIYRNVWLTSTDKLHVPQWGTFVTTPSVSQDSATIDVNIKLKNGYKVPKNAKISTKIMLDGKEIALFSSEEITISANKTDSLSQK